MEGDTTARPIGRTEPVSIVWREPPRMSVSLSRSSKFANKSSLSMSPSPRAHWMHRSLWSSRSRATLRWMDCRSCLRLAATI